MRPFVKFAVAAAALLSSTVVNASDFTEEQLTALQITTSAEYAGYDDHCPRFRVIEKEVYRELFVAGFRAADIKTEKFDFWWRDGLTMAGLAYDSNPSQYCEAAWQLLGPNGTYKRQMLEAK
jgi:hypothetical protein